MHRRGRSRREALAFHSEPSPSHYNVGDHRGSTDGMSNYGNRWPLVLLFLVAVLLRLAAIHWLAGTPQQDSHEEQQNERPAISIVAHTVSRSAMIPHVVVRR